MSKRSLFIAAIVLAFAGGAQAATLIVTNPSDGPAPGPAGSLRRAIRDAASGDTINFSLPASSTATLMTAELLIEKNLTINGPGANLLRVQRDTATGTPQFRIFAIRGESNVTISGLTIANGISDSGGGGIFNTGTLTITNSTLSGNAAVNGGGIFNNGTLTITNGTISGNSAGSDGGGIFNGGTMTISNSTISGNSSLNSGGGIDISGGGTLTARNTIVAGNTAVNGGSDVFGALTSQGYNLIGNTSRTIITGPTTGNQLNVDPKLGLLQDNGGPTFTHALLSGSTAIEGGNSFGSNTDQRGFARPVDSPAINNATGGDGSDIGAYEVQADLLPGCNNIDPVVNNNNDSGAGSLRAVIANVCAGSTITFASNVRGAINLTSGELLINKSLTISGPGANLLTVQRSAAAGTPDFRIFFMQGNFNVSISGLTIANGISDSSGGSIFNPGTLMITNSTISANSAGSNGGGIYNGGTMTITNSTITNSTISGNSAVNGGGIFNSGTLTITNSTISGNSAVNGGGIFNSDGGTAVITNSTISGNSAVNGGGIYNVAGTLISRNTIIALNTSPSGPDCNGSLTSQGFNLIGNNAGATIAPAQFSDQIGVTAAQLNLGPLQDNGGPTPTQALLSGGFAIDKGNSSGSSTDQRGFARPVDNPAIPNASGGDGGDIGAFEFGGAAASLKILSITRSGNGPVVLQVAGVPNGVHRIQASVDLSFGSFIDIATVTADASGLFQYQDPVAGLTNFYRVAFP